MDRDALAQLKIAGATEALRTGDAVTAAEWLAGSDPAQQPAQLDATIQYMLAKQALGRRQWGTAERHLKAAAAAGHESFYQERLSLLRRRRPLIDDHIWQVLNDAVHPATRLPERLLQPEVVGVWACGAYFSRGRDSGAPWSRFLRLAKNPPSEDREGVLALAPGYLCRWVAEHTRVLAHVDVVVPIPANPTRYGERMMSLPDELAQGVQSQLAVPMAFDALRYTADDLELRGMSPAERRRAIVGSMAVGDSRLVAGRNVLIVDDVLTSGATVGEAGRLLHAAGAGEVFAVCLAHTEG